ncbi:MAG: ATP phosphoribosyltransferase regulatory subunit [Peptococcaceae bacterium]|jgi:ATP phosphoribosyltransferase regulatory subunit|nr:ATP phosphoribosyltransferase regulatory subunit [Peptococcaceae bacterium]
MSKDLLRQRIPEGMMDLLPETAGLLEDLERDMMDLFRLWAYDRVTTPTVEFAACVQTELDREDHLFKFFDRSGRILALRPEFTPPIARMVSSRMHDMQFPLRLSYGGSVFRNTSGRQREFRQIGVELIGSASAMADAEIIALAIEALRALGIEEFQLSVGEMNIFSGLIEECGIGADVREQLENALSRKDLVAIEQMAENHQISEQARRILRRLPHLRGGAEILDEVSRLSDQSAVRSAVAHLRQVYDYLGAFGVQDALVLDMGVLREFAYYTGIVFEGYVAGIAFPVIEGGRYDHLYDDFRHLMAATGFALNLSSLLKFFPRKGLMPDQRLIDGDDPEAVIRRCREERAQGKRTAMALK